MFAGAAKVRKRLDNVGRDNVSPTTSLRVGVSIVQNSLLITPVIMCGGAGTRLWPASRESMPKQFMPLLGERSSFQETLLRVADPAVFGRPVIVTASDFRFIVAEQLLEIGIEADIILEPARRDSAAAVAVAAEFVARRDPAGGGAGAGRRPPGDRPRGLRRGLRQGGRRGARRG